LANRFKSNMPDAPSSMKAGDKLANPGAGSSDSEKCVRVCF
jgi:hypothetical protein